MSTEAWYYTKGSERMGPVDFAQMRELIGSGRVASSDLVWRAGMANWLPLSSVPELSGQAAATSAPAGSDFSRAPSVSPQQNHPQQDYQSQPQQGFSQPGAAPAG